MKNGTLAALITCLLLFCQVRAQQQKINELIALCLKNSYGAQTSQLMIQNAEASYVLSRETLKPRVSLVSNLPGYTRAINSILQPDGSQRFLLQSQAYSSAGITVSQKLPFSGGEVFISSGLNRIDNFVPNNYHTWQSTPILFSYSQPLFQFNSTKFQKRLAELSFEIGRKNYKAQNARLVYEFVSLLMEKNFYAYSVDMHRKRLLYLDETLKHTGDMVEAGKLLKEEKDLLEIEKIRTSSELNKLLFDLQQSEKSLDFYLRDAADTRLELHRTLPPMIDSALLMSGITAASPNLLQAKVNQLNAEAEFERVAKSRGVQASINLSVGLNQRASNFTDVYSNPLDQETASLSLVVPLFNRRNINSQMLINKNLVKMTAMTYSKDSLMLIKSVVEQFWDYRLQLAMQPSEERVVEMARSRFERYHDLFVAGKISVDKLNEVELAYRQAEITHIQNLTELWKNYYLLRTFIPD